MENIGKNYNTDNDLKSHIIYKNFESDVIEKNARMLLEIKKSFDLFKLLLQIKQNVKIINHLNLNNEQNNIKLPQVIIGIMCNFNVEKDKILYKSLYQNYKNEENSILQHNIDIINEEIKKTKIKVVIGAIKDGKIGKYPLNLEDYNIEDPEIKTKSDFRVDLKLLNELALDNSCNNEDIKNIKQKYSPRYDSISYEKKFTLSNKEYSLLSSSSEESKQLKEKLKEMEEKNKKKEEEMKKMIEQKEEKIRKKKKK